MANEKISELPSGSPAQPSDEIPIARGGSNFQILASDIANLASTLGGGIEVSLGGNTAGALQPVSSGTLFLAGGPNVTLSQIGNSVSISAGTAAAANLSVSAGGSSGNFGGITFAPANGLTWGLNNGTITGSVAAQSVQTQASGNIGATGFATTTQAGALIAGTHNTVGFTLGVPAFLTTQSVQTQASGAIAGTGVTTTTQAGSTLGVTHNTAGLSLALPPWITTAAGGGGGIDVSLGGNTAGALALVSTGTLFLAGGPNVTLSQNGNSVSISAGTAAAANLSVSAGTTSGAFGGVTFNNANGVSFGLNNGTISASVAAQSVQTQASGNIGATGFATTTAAGSVIVGTNNTAGFTLGVPPFLTAAGGGANTATVSALGNTTQASSGTLALSAFNVSAAGLISAGISGNTLFISAPATTGLSQSMFAASNTTLGTSGTQTIGQLTLAGAGNVSVGVSNGSYVISGAGGGAGGGVNFGVSTGGNTAGATGTVSTGNVVLVGSGPISLSQATGAAGSAATITINAPPISSISGTGQVSVAVGGSTISIGVPIQSVFVTGNSTQASSGTLSSVGSLLINAAGGLSAGFSNGSLVLSGGAGGGVATATLFATGNTTQGSTATAALSSLLFNGAGGNTVGFSNGSVQISGVTTAGLISAFKVSAGASSVNATAVTYSNSGGVSFGISTGASVGTITAAVATTQALFFAGNTTGQSSSSTVADQSISYSLGGAISGGMSNGSVLLSAPATSSISGTGLVSVVVNASTISIGAAIQQLSFFQPLGPVQNTTVTQNGAGTVQVYPAIAAFPFSASRVDMMVSASAAVLAVSTEAQTISMFVGLYSLNASTLTLLSSGSQSYAMTNSSNGSNASITGIRRLSAPINVNYTGGFDLFIGVMTNTTFANTNGISFSNVVVPLGPGQQLQGLIGQVPSNSMQFVPGQGLWSTTSAGMPSSMAISAISGAGSGGNAIDNYQPVQFANVTA